MAKEDIICVKIIGIPIKFKLFREKFENFIIILKKNYVNILADVGSFLCFSGSKF